ncbi:MAG TPA: lysophospholipid acyltransferase family protein [Myxococcota bacterium]|nr:lysophospholipid acyltransferase family protein [Myxococcota bacterium]
MEPAKYRPSLVERAIAVVVAWLVRALGATLRYEHEGGDVLGELLSSGNAAIIFGWHELVLIACCDLTHYAPYVMVSQSRDGERATRVAEKLRWHVVRGSSSRGGARGLLQMLRALREPVLVGHLVDGPRGPRRELKPGLVAMAQRSGAAIVPTVYGTRWKWCAPSWDRLQIPLPFARIVRRHLPARCVPADLDAAGAEKLRVELQAELTRAYEELDRELLGQPAP